MSCATCSPPMATLRWAACLLLISVSQGRHQASSGPARPPLDQPVLKCICWPGPQDCFIPQDRESGRPRGFAFVTMSSGSDQAIQSLNETDFQVRGTSRAGWARFGKAGGPRHLGGSCRGSDRCSCSDTCQGLSGSGSARIINDGHACTRS